MAKDDKEIEVPASPEMLAKVLADASGEAILVGGQALGYWASKFGLDSFVERTNAGIRSITDDIDLLGSRSDVEAIATRLKGYAMFPFRRGIGALVGQVKIYTDRSAKPPTYVNIDVIHHVVGLDADDVRKHALEVQFDGVVFRVMHPLDVLASRVENLYRIKDKQSDKGQEQTLLAVLVAREYILEQLVRQGNEKVALRAIERVVDIAKSPAGRAAARDFHVQFKAGLPLDFVNNEAFRERRLPRLLEELGDAPGPPTPD